MNYLLYPFLALAPSLLWLFFYVRKDLHPEAKRMIAKVFLYGLVATVPAYLIERAIELKLSFLPVSPFTAAWIYFFIVVGVTEEICKYFAAKWGAFSSSELDEPMDVIEYMIIAALGFAAFENLLYLLPHDGIASANSFVVTLQRFVGATFLHALASGTFGCFLMLAFAKQNREISITLAGLFVASSLHGLFNFSIIYGEGYWKLIIPLAILFGLAFFLSWGMQRARKMKGICVSENAKFKIQMQNDKSKFKII